MWLSRPPADPKAELVMGPRLADECEDTRSRRSCSNDGHVSAGGLEALENPVCDRQREEWCNSEDQLEGE